MELWKLLIDKVANIGGVEELKKGVMEFLKEKVGQRLHLLNDIGGFFKKRVDQLFPLATLSDTLSRWARVDLIVALLLTLAFLFYCCRGGGGGGGAAGKMMKAPGGRGRFIRRASFESNPGAYFRNQRRRQ